MAKWGYWKKPWDIQANVELIEEGNIFDIPEYLLAVDMLVSQRNARASKAGFSPDQRAFGRNLRLPGHILSDDKLDADLVGAAAGDNIRRMWDIQEAAARTCVSRRNKEACKAALTARRRGWIDKEIPEGSWVMVWRKYSELDSGSWVGPGLLLAKSPKNKSLWVNMAAKLWKCSREQVRLATEEEDLAVEVATALSKEFLEDTVNERNNKYVDVTADVPPEAFEPVPIFSDAFDTDGPLPISIPETELSTIPASSITHAEDVAPVPESREIELSVPQSRRVPPSQLERPAQRPRTNSSSTAGEPDGELTPVESTTARTRGVSVATTVRHLRELERRDQEGRQDVSTSSRTPMPYPAPPFGTNSPSASSNRLEPYLQSNSRAQKPKSYYHVIRPDGYNTPEEAQRVAKLDGPQCFLSSDAAKWTPKCQRGSCLESLGSDTFGKSDAVLTFSHKDQCFYVTHQNNLSEIRRSPVEVYVQQKTAAGSVNFRALGESDMQKFQDARNKEGWTLQEVGAVRILSVADSREFIADDPEAVVDSLWVERWKNTGDGPSDCIAKSRWCVVGWQDPDIHEIERSSPMPTDSATNLAAQIIAVRKWKLRFRDVQQAFAQSLKSNRKRPLACRQPRTGPFPGCTDPEQIILLETEVYGLVSGPAWWRVTFISLFTAEGYVINHLER